MAPFLQQGDRVVLAAATSQSLHVGEIVVLDVLPRPLVHRLVAVIGRGSNVLLVTKGDSGAMYDLPLGLEALLGRVVAVERGAYLLPLTGFYAHIAGRLLAATSCLCVSSACLRPRFLRRTTFCLLRLAMHAVAALAWRSGCTKLCEL
jgi:hypothetical protein